jgi:hypothetical protein
MFGGILYNYKEAVSLVPNSDVAKKRKKERKIFSPSLVFLH